MLFHYLDLSHRSTSDLDWVVHPLNKLSIPWIVDSVVTAVVHEWHFEILVLVGVVQIA